MSFLPLRQLVWLTLSWKAYVGPRPRPEPVLQFLLACAVGPAALTVEAAARAATSARPAISAEVRGRRCMGGSSVRDFRARNLGTGSGPLARAASSRDTTLRRR